MTRLHVVAPGVLVATSRTDTTNTVAVSGSSGTLLIDPAWHADELDELAVELVGYLSPVAGLATHAHHDHLLWHPSFGNVPRWASADTARLARSERADLLGSLGPGYADDILALFARVQVASADAIEWDGPDAELLVHEAHVPGHTAVWFPSLGVLVAGDMLSDLELPLLDNDRTLDAVATYRAGLELLAPYAARASLVIPGHGHPTDRGAARVEADRAYLDALDAGRDAADARLAHHGMPEAHAANLRLASRA